MNAVEEPILQSSAATATGGNAEVRMQNAERKQDVHAGPPRIIANGNTEAPVKRGKKRVVLLMLSVVVLIGGSFAVMSAIHAAHFQSTDDAYIEGRIVNISPQVSAAVKRIPKEIDDNKFVHKGDVLVELDSTDFDVALEQAKATLGAMQGKCEQAKSEINGAIASRDQAAAEVEVAQANSINAIADFNRFTELSKHPGAVSKQQMDSATATWQSSLATVKQAKAKLANADAEIATKRATAAAAEGDVNKAAADVHKAMVNLSYCTILAPEDGKITKKNVEPGSYVQTGEQLMAIVPNDVWVIANFKETQLDKMRIGQPVTISVDAYPGKDLHGHVDSIQSGTGSRFSMLPAENATGNFVKVVQRVPVKILLDEKNGDMDRLLTPGMSVLPEVDVR